MTNRKNKHSKSNKNGDLSRRKVLFFSRSVLFEHPVIQRQNGALSFAEKKFVEQMTKINCDVECTKDGQIFEQDLDQYAAIVTYSCGKPEDLMKSASKDGAPALTADGWKNLDRAVLAGTPLIGIHPGLWLHTEAFGADCIGHGSQQVSKIHLTSPQFPGLQNLSETFSMMEEWFSLVSFNEDLHVILVQDCADMNIDRPDDLKCYARKPFPATWARMYGKGRVFYTSMGHREDVCTSDIFRQVLLAGMSWALGDTDADISPNISHVSPEANDFVQQT